MTDVAEWGGSRAVAATAEFKAESEACAAPCWLCQQPIDYAAPAGTPDAFELDHYYPRSEYPELTWDPSNFRAAHSSCNRARGKRDAPLGLGPLSAVW